MEFYATAPSFNTVCLAKAVPEIYRIHPTLVFVDLDICAQPEEIYKVLKAISKKITLIGLASEYKTAFYAYKEGVSDVLKKPLQQTEVLACLLKVQKKPSREKKIQISSKKDHYFLKAKDIVYLKADDHTVDIYISDGSILPIFKPLKYFEYHLSPPFFRIHKSYMVNAQHIFRIHEPKKYIKVVGSTVPLPYSPTYIESIAALIQYSKNECF